MFLVDLGKLSEPATVLVNRVSDAVGGIAKPWQIKRVKIAEAQAEVQAAVIKANGDAELREIQERAVRRFLNEETAKQINIESITAKALPDVKPDAKPQDLATDWLADFFDKCRLVSDEQMQALWARTLAGEANSPGRFLKRTIAILASMDQTDVGFIETLSQFQFDMFLLVYDCDEPIYKKAGLTKGILHHLSSIGVISEPNASNDFYVEHVDLMIGDQIIFKDGERRRLHVILPNKVTRMNIGKISPTAAGDQLLELCKSNSPPGFGDYLTKVWRGFGYQVRDVATVDPISAPALEHAEDDSTVPMVQRI